MNEEFDYDEFFYENEKIQKAGDGSWIEKNKFGKYIFHGVEYNTLDDIYSAELKENAQNRKNDSGKSLYSQDDWIVMKIKDLKNKERKKSIYEIINEKDTIDLEL
jgi:hypothetical protein